MLVRFKLASVNNIVKKRISILFESSPEKIRGSLILNLIYACMRALIVVLAVYELFFVFFVTVP